MERYPWIFDEILDMIRSRIHDSCCIDSCFNGV